MLWVELNERVDLQHYACLRNLFLKDFFDYMQVLLYVLSLESKLSRISYNLTVLSWW